MMSVAPMARVRRLLALVAASLALGLAVSPAAAQIEVPTPKVFSGTDRNGVDMVSGSLTMNVGSVSVGPAEGGAIAQHFRKYRIDRWRVHAPQPRGRDQ